MNDLETRFNYHPANTPERRGAHDDVRLTLLRTAEKLIELTPPGREQSLAATKIEEAMFWANAAIARQPADPPRAGTRVRVREDADVNDGLQGRVGTVERVDSSPLFKYPIRVALDNDVQGIHARTFAADELEVIA